MCDTPLNASGIMADFWVGGTMTFTIAVLNANFKILLLSYKYSVLHIFCILLSLIVYYISFVIPNSSSPTSNLYHVLNNQQRAGAYYLAIIVIVVVTTIFELGIIRYNGKFRSYTQL
jgi:hypothetical protein